MKALLRFLFGNWALKVGAVVLALSLYGAMVVLQTTQQWPGAIAIDIQNQPTSGYLLEPSPMPQVTNIRYLAAPDVPVSQSSFHATIDLSNAKVSETEQSLVNIKLAADDQRIQIIDYRPQQISVTLDPIVHKQVNVQVNKGTPPAGLQPGTPILSAASVDVSGAATYVRKVVYAEATVRIDASGLDVNEDVDLVAKDASGAVVNNVTFGPRQIHVQILVGSQIRSETVPINAVITGNPAAGYIITSVDVTPAAVSVLGQADALTLLKGQANTKPISVAGATSDVSQNVGLDLPNGVTTDAAQSVSVVVHLQAQSSTRTVTVGVVPAGARPDRIYGLSVPTVTITLGGPTAALNALDASTLVATAQVGGLNVGSSTVILSVTVPPGIRLLSIAPSQINVTVTIVPSPSPPAPSPT